MKKRILAFLCSVILLLPSFTALADYKDVQGDTAEARVIDIITKLGIMVGYEEDGGTYSFKPGQDVTRAEFVTVIRNSIKYWNALSELGEDNSLVDTSGFNWLQFFLGSTNTELELMYPEGEGDETGAASNKLWSDVDEDHWAYSNMKDVALLGVIHGYPDGTFRPDNTVSYNEAVKIVLSLCGYDEYAQSTGGFPDGYTKLAERFGLGKSIVARGTEPMTRMDVATLIYNSFSLELVSPIDDTKRNFLNDIVGVYLLEGTLERTDITSITGIGNNSMDIATVAGTDFEFDTDSNIRDYIGQYIRVYLKKRGDDYVMQTFEPMNKDDITVIDISLFDSYSDNTFYYKKSQDSDQLKKINVQKGSVLIYNGNYLAPFNTSTFENLNQGTITVIEKSDLNYDVIVVENFESGYTEKINVNEMNFIDVVKTNVGGEPVVSLKGDDENEQFVYSVTDENGNAVDLAKLQPCAVNYYSSDNYVKVYTSSATASGTISRIRTEDGESYITVGGEEYALSKDMSSYVKSSLSIGTEVQLYIDRYGKVAWMTDNISIADYHYLIKVRKDDENDRLILRYYDITNKAVMESYTTSEISFTNRKNETKKVSVDTVWNAISGYNDTGVVLNLKFDSEGNIKKIAMPLDSTIDDKTKLKEIATGNFFVPYTYAADGKYYFNSNTVVVTVPSDMTDYAKYKVGTYTDITIDERAWQKTALQIYTFDTENAFMKLVIKKSATASETSGTTGSGMIYVTSVLDTIDEDMQSLKQIKGYKISNGEAVSYYAEIDELTGKSAFDTAMQPYGMSGQYKIQKGDIVSCAISDEDGYVVSTRMYYDANAINPAWCKGADPDDMLTVCNKDHTHTTVLGNIPGNTGFKRYYYDEDGVGQLNDNTNPNPFMLTGATDNALVTAISESPWVPGLSEPYYTYGFVYSVTEGLYNLTTQNLRDPSFTGVPDEDKYSYQIDKQYNWMSPITFTIIEDGMVRIGTADDVRSYKNYGEKCDKIFAYSSRGLKNLIIIRD